MINFILPDFYNSFAKNQELINEFNYKNIFYGIEGCFSFSIFNGKCNNNKTGMFVAYEDIVRSIRQYEEISDNFTIIDFGNKYLEPFDYEDAFGAVVLEEYADKTNVFFEVSDPNFIEYLTTVYPTIQLILHENYTMFHTEDEISKLIDKYPSNIKGIVITLFNLCPNLEFPKIGLLNLDICYFCNQYPLCLKTESKNILRYRSHSQFNLCHKKTFLNFDNIILNLKELLKYTNIINFSNISADNIDTYYQIIRKIFEWEQEEENNEIF